VYQGKSRSDLEHSFSSELPNNSKRDNIGLAAEYGVYFDDTEYDYMQHLRTIGQNEGGVDSILLEAPSNSRSGRKAKESTFAIRDASSQNRTSSSVLPVEALPSSAELPRNYESQLNIPSSISGFRPDMNPHLRQTLEALEDDAFVDNSVEEDFFAELMGDGEVPNEDEVDFPFAEQGIRDDMLEEEDVHVEHSDQDESWETRFSRFKKEQERLEDEDDSETERGYGASEGGDTVGTLPHMSVVGIRKRRRKGASDASGYSMSSSSMYRNEGLTTLDEQFDQVRKFFTYLQRSTKTVIIVRLC
jgi:protein LTV1